MATAPADLLIRATGLNTYYGASHILRGVDFSVGRAETIGLMGRNGMGKSTLLKSIMGLVKPRSGTVEIMGQPMTGRPPYEIAQLGIAYVPEGRGIFGNLSVVENLKMAARAGTRGQRDWTYERVLETFPRLKERLGHGGQQLSGGEQQMLTIARTLMGSPDLILLDEPTEGLAPIMVMEVMKIIKELKEKGETILLVEQNSTLALSVSQRAYILENGHVVYAGPAEELARNAEVKQRYLGI
jgi:branched-chain amino acid transport system ATP-binding protein